MEKAKAFIQKYREQIAYVLFGGITTLVNMVGYAVCARIGLPTAVANAIAWILSVLTAYVTNRIWVFKSRTNGADMLKEFAEFVGCRAATGVLDEVIMILGVDHLHLWNHGVKLFSNVFVILLNYVFSKLFIFNNKSSKQ